MEKRGKKRQSYSDEEDVYSIGDEDCDEEASEEVDAEDQAFMRGYNEALNDEEEEDY